MNVSAINKDRCTGCGLCQEICISKSITMSYDYEGFMIPKIDNSSCSQCGICYESCPSIKNVINYNALPNSRYFAAIINDKKDLLDSSSGGVFIALAKYVILNNGYVCGCIINENNIAVHICTNDINILKKMSGSKYVQSQFNDCLKDISHLLNENKLVLVSGTACQIAATKLFTNNHPNLLCIDVLCHGVPSPRYYHEYVRFLEKKHSGKLVKLDFRNKYRDGWGSEHRTYYEIFKNGTLKGYRPNMPAYFCAFFWSLNLRYSCYSCKYAGDKRISDITLGDFWGSWKYYKKNFRNGISIISINTEIGFNILSNMKQVFELYEEVPQDIGKGSNTNFYHSTLMPVTRKNFYKFLNKTNAYKNSWKVVFLDKTCRRKLLVSLYGCYIPKSIREFRHKFNS